MKKNIKTILIIVAIILCIVFAALYFFATKDTIYKMIYFTPEQAFNGWHPNSQDVVCEFEDETFAVRFYSNSEIYSVKKNGLFWVKNDYDHVSENDTNFIRAISVGDVMYIYGITKTDAERVSVLDYALSEQEFVYTGKRIENMNALCFSIAISRVNLYASINFIDSEGLIISTLPETENDDIYPLLESALEQVKIQPQKINDQPFKSSSTDLTKKLQESFYIIAEDGGYSFQEYSEYIDIQFYDDYILMRDQKIIIQRGKTIQTSNYSTVYNAQYTKELLELKDHVLQVEE